MLEISKENIKEMTEKLLNLVEDIYSTSKNIYVLNLEKLELIKNINENEIKMKGDISSRLNSDNKQMFTNPAQRDAQFLIESKNLEPLYNKLRICESNISSNQIKLENLKLIHNTYIKLIEFMG